MATCRRGLLFLTDRTLAACLLLLFSRPVLTASSPWKANPFFRRPSFLSSYRSSSQKQVNELLPRGGAIDNGEEESIPEQAEATTSAEEERYSRQVYTLGKRAHSLIRSSTAYLNGPPTSGLMYEVSKNLALSGIHSIVLVDNEEDSTNAYHDAALDDLGAAYGRAATQETQGGTNEHGHNENDNGDAGEILLEYIKRLNPSVQVARCQAGELITSPDKEDKGPIVYMAIDRPLSRCQELNAWIREQSSSRPIRFVAVETAGVYSLLFCDFGDTFVVHNADGETPLVTPLLQIVPMNAIDNNKDATGRCTAKIHCMPGEKHDVSKGDVLQFHLRNGQVLTNDGDGNVEAPRCVVQRVESPYLIQVEFENSSSLKRVTSMTESQQQVVAFSRNPQPETIQFVSLEEAKTRVLQDKYHHRLVTPSDLDKSLDPQRQQVLLSCFGNLDRFLQRYGRLPESEDISTILEAMQEEQQGSSMNDNYEPLVSKFVHSCKAKFVPLQGVIGAIAAQEALKAVSGLYTPIRQFLFLDFEQVLLHQRNPTKMKDEVDTAAENMQFKAAGLRYILGHDVVDQLQSRRVFVVGAGAIGCELLKNLAAMGIATCRENGKIYLTDMDTIEKSNLSRQLLFRDADLGQFKSLAAERAALMFNPLCQIEAHSSKVGAGVDASSSPFGQESFWSEKVDVILNALDNVEARLYMDGQCVKYHKPLVDAGTLGPKGNLQVVLPGLSESYASSADPPDEAIPVCTLKNFPYAIQHTIQWARDLFDGLFVQRPRQANYFCASLQDEGLKTNTDLKDGNILAHLAHKLEHEAGKEAALVAARELAEDLMTVEAATTDKGELNVASIRAKALEWAVQLAKTLYDQSVDDLLEQHPLDSKDEDGESFWSGTRRPPSKLLFLDTAAGEESAEQKVIDENLVSFVRHAARLRAETFLSTSGDVLFTAQDARDGLRSLSSSSPADVCSNEEESNVISSSDTVLGHLSVIPSDTCVALNLADFEKDDESNGHVAFITAASNLRALAYGIPPVDAMETRRVAGKIIPAMITTTAVVSALSCVELVQVVQHAPLHYHRNAFVNLALNFFAFTAPLPAETTLGLQGREYTLWDQLSIQESSKAANKGGLTVKSLLRKIQQLASDDPDSVQVASISLGPYLLYANFLHEDDRHLLKSSIWDVIAEALLDSERDDEEGFAGRYGDVGTTTSGPQHTTVFDLSVVVEDMESGEEVELPIIRLRRFLPGNNEVSES